MKREYLTFVRNFKDLKEGRQELFIKDLAPGPRKYDTLHVLAEISSRPKKIPDGQILQVRSESGALLPQSWRIRILEELPESVPGQPWEDVYEAIEKQKR